MSGRLPPWPSQEFPPIRSITDLRGILADKTDEQGRTATKLLREERERDEASEAALRDRYTDADEGDE